jgi:hypothetical protein
MSTLKNRVELMRQLEARGFSFDEAESLRRIEMTLHRWAEQECGDGNAYASWAIERDQETDKPYRCVYPNDSNNVRRTPIPDREKGALKRLAKIMESHPDFVSYHQGDPRGCALYILRKSDLNGQDINSVYTRGLAVCV